MWLASSSRSQMARTTDSSTVRPGKSADTWNVRAIPRFTRRACAQAGAERGDRAEGAAAAEEDDDHQQEPQPELPVDGVEIGEHRLRDHEDRRPDQPPVEPPGAAEDEHDEDVRRAREAEHLQP